MCYRLYLSTSSDDDLTRHNSEFIRFRPLEPADEQWADVLRYPHKWFVGSKSECSCTFRHFVTRDSGFGEPEDWCSEEDDDIRATAELYRVIGGLISAGEHVDCLDTLWDAKPDEIKDMTVAVSAVSEKQFLLFENYHFLFDRQ